MDFNKQYSELVRTHPGAGGGIRMHAEICPVCGGKGRLQISQVSTSTDASMHEETCHGCGGKGWIEVQNDVHEGIGAPMRHYDSPSENEYEKY
jgi:DnaJ-class molecular chaperone